MATKTTVSKTPARKPAARKPAVKAAPARVAESPAAKQPLRPVEQSPAKTKPAAPKAAPAQPKEVTKMEATFNHAAAKGQAYFADLNDFSKGNVEALVESGKIAATGLQSLGQGYAAYARRQIEGVTATMQRFAAVKSPTE